jgi:ribosomal-protein-alanine N-acetyltransferase
MSEQQDPVFIRHMMIDDVPAVMAIDRLSFPIPWPEHSYYFELNENPASSMFVAEDPTHAGRPVVGYLGYWLIVDEAHISTIAVHPEARGRRIGKQLMLAAIESAAQRGAQAATLEVRVSNLVARRLYQDLGFEVVGRRAGYYRDNREDALYMTLSELRHFDARQTSTKVFRAGGGM